MTLYLIAPPSLSGAATWPVVVGGGGALYCDAWTSLGRLYGAAVGLILLVDGRGGGGGGGRGWGFQGRRAQGGKEGGRQAPPRLAEEKESEPGAELEGGTQHIVLPSPPV